MLATAAVALLMLPAVASAATERALVLLDPSPPSAAAVRASATAVLARHGLIATEVRGEAPETRAGRHFHGHHADLADIRPGPLQAVAGQHGGRGRANCRRRRG